MVSPAELTYFIEVAHSLNFSRASERLGISQPSLSLAMRRLEEAIGIGLFIRHKKGVLLTQAGKQLLSHAKQLLQYWDGVKSKTLASTNVVEGSFILGCHPTIALRYLSKILPGLFNQHPRLEIQLLHDISRKITEGVISLAIDVAIVVNPIKHPDLIIQKLGNDIVTFWQAQQSKINLANNDAVVICDPELGQTQWLLKQAERENIHYKRMLRSSNIEVIADLTANDAGIGILPGNVVKTFFQDRLKPVPHAPIYEDEICLIYRPENRDIRAIQVIINAIKSLFSDH